MKRKIGVDCQSLVVTQCFVGNNVVGVFVFCEFAHNMSHIHVIGRKDVGGKIKYSALFYWPFIFSAFILV